MLYKNGKMFVVKKKELKTINLPKNWEKIKVKYDIKNQQGLSFVSNFLTSNNNILSLFVAEEGLGLISFDLMLKDYSVITSDFKLKKKFNVNYSSSATPIQFPIYIVEGKGRDLFAQCFFEVNGYVYSLVTFLNEGGKDFKEYEEKNSALKDMVEFLKGIK